jgi:hypothetical protein
MRRYPKPSPWTAALTPTNLCCGLAIAALAAGLAVLARHPSAEELYTPLLGYTHPSPDPAAIRARVWGKAEGLLAEAEQHSSDALDKHLASIHAFLDERKAGSRAFAERLLGLRGKWELLKSEIGSSGDYTAFLQEAFSEHLFPMEELEKAVAAAVQGYLAELDGLEDELLVRLRADLSDDERPRLAIPALRSEQVFRHSYHVLSRRVAQDLRTDLVVVAGRELFLWQATNVATELTLQVGTALTARLGVSGTILSAGAASTWRTLGVSLVVALVLDAVINRIIKAAGYDAEEQIAERVGQTLSDLGRTITDGDPEARATLEQLKTMQRDDPEPDVRSACAEAIQRIEAGTRLYGLRRELTKISAARASLRRETLRRLIHDPEVTP